MLKLWMVYYLRSKSGPIMASILLGNATTATSIKLPAIERLTHTCERSTKRPRMKLTGATAAGVVGKMTFKPRSK